MLKCLTKPHSKNMSCFMTSGLSIPRISAPCHQKCWKAEICDPVLWHTGTPLNSFGISCSGTSRYKVATILAPFNSRYINTKVLKPKILVFHSKGRSTTHSLPWYDGSDPFGISRVKSSEILTLAFPVAKILKWPFSNFPETSTAPMLTVTHIFWNASWDPPLSVSLFGILGVAMTWNSTY